MSVDVTTENGKVIRDVIQAAEEPIDPLKELIRKAATDPGAPFEQGNIALLAQLQVRDQPQFERTRTALSQTDVRMGELDKAINRHGQVERPRLNGAPLTFEQIEPWPEPVNGELLLEEIVALLKRHLVLPPYSAEAASLWVLFSHVHDFGQISPRLAFVSPEKRCGKTTALSIIQHLVPKPLPASNITAAALFRSIEQASPTLIIDEADTFLKDNNDLRGILNSGHNRSQACVVRTIGEDHTPAKFCTWAPVAIAMIGNLPDTLNDRSIVIKLKRKSPADKVERFRLDRVDHIQELRRKIARWAIDNMPRLKAWDGGVPDALHDRAADNWRPLIAIADTIGGSWPDKAREVAVGITGTDDQGSAGVMLLRDIGSVFNLAGKGRLPTKDIVDQLNQMEDRPWPEFRNGKPLSASQLAALLKPFGIKPTSTRFEGGLNVKGYTLAGFEDAFTRYLPLEAVTPSQTNRNNNLMPNDAVTRENVVTAEKAGNGNDYNGCDVVTAANEGGGQIDELPDLPEFLRRKKETKMPLGEVRQ